MHWPPTNQQTATLQSYLLLVSILQRCETWDSIGLYSVSECTRNVLMDSCPAQLAEHLTKFILFCVTLDLSDNLTET